MRAQAALRTRDDYRRADGVLLVLRAPPPPASPAPGQPTTVPGDPAEGDEILLAVWDDGSATVLHGRVDLGTGLRTALGQIAAEELGLPFERVHVVLGDTARAPNQGPTIASASIQIHAQPLRQAAAQARAWLLAQDTASDASDALSASAASGLAAQCAVLRGRRVELRLDPGTPLKHAADYRIVGQPVLRVDIPAKAAGEAVFVHDLRRPGMLHGRVIRPPYAGVDAGDFVGRTLEAVEADSIAHIPGVRAIVTLGDFVGVVCEREEHAEQAMRELAVRWKPWPGLPPLADLAQALRANPATQRVVAQHGDLDAALAGASVPVDRTYVWPYQLHASIGPSCAVAEWLADGPPAADPTAGDARPGDGRDGPAPPLNAVPQSAGAAPPPRTRLRVWAGTQNPHVLRADLARLTGLADTAVEVVRLEASGCYGRNGADDVAADAALLSRAVGAPVRVQLSREQEHAWEPKGAAQLMTVRSGLDAQGRMAAYDFATSYPSNAAPTLALLLTRTIEPVAQSFEMGDRTAVPPYTAPALRVTVNDMPPILRASWLRGVSALPNSFAHESCIDELATAAAADPVDFRLAHLLDERAAELVRATAARAEWRPHTAPRQQAAVGDWLPGQGFAYARYMHSKFPGYGAAWSAWVADVDVNRVTGEVHVKRVVVGHDAGLVVNPAGLQHQVHGNVLQTTSRALKESVALDPQTGAVVAREWGAYPILSFREVPVVEVVSMPRPGEPPLGAGESASVPGTAAIANAIFDATGVRLREPPFTPEVVRAAMHAASSAGERAATGVDRALASPASPAVAPLAGALPPPGVPAAARPSGLRPTLRRKGLWATAAALATALFGVAAAALGWRPAIAPVSLSALTVYSAQTLARGRQLAALGNCVGCHTAPGGVPNAGGRAMETPFGTVYSSNLTPDPETGLGRWSFSAFQRAMREGISRDGHHLYPAFPYTAFTRASDDDLQALYAHLMAQPAVAAPTPVSELRFPFNLRPLMALWNALFLVPGPTTTASADPAQSALWNRGAELVEGLGHCSACHTPRNALGAERRSQHFAGAMVDGWEAPPLNALSRAPVAWNEEQLYRYLRHGHSPEHGSAAGPMAPVVRQLAGVADADLRAMAHYLGSLQQAVPGAPTAEAVVAQAAGRAAQAAPGPSLERSAEPRTEPVPERLPELLPGAAQRLFQGACGACHHDGDGPMTLGPNIPLALNSQLHSDRPDNLLRTVLHGIREPATPESGQMPAFRDALDDAQLVQLAAWMRLRFAPGRPAWTDLARAATEARTATGH